MHGRLASSLSALMQSVSKLPDAIQSGKMKTEILGFAAVVTKGALGTFSLAVLRLLQIEENA
jgi:hypothetical protein